MTRERDYDACLQAPTLTAAEIRRYRRSLGMSRDEFARAFDVPVATLGDWERGRHARALADAVMRLWTIATRGGRETRGAAFTRP